MAGLTIGKLPAGEGVGVETVRFYQRRGLLAQPERAGSGFREYSEDDRQRLAFIRRARRLGFTLGEIGDLLGSGDDRRTGDIIRAAEAKLAAISQQISELTQLQCRLRRLVGSARVRRVLLTAPAQDVLRSRRCRRSWAASSISLCRHSAAR
jgi:DNA-binding transcriptional MerR regulator